MVAQAQDRQLPSRGENSDHLVGNQAIIQERIEGKYARLSFIAAQAYQML